MAYEFSAAPSGGVFAADPSRSWMQTFGERVNSWSYSSAAATFTLPWAFALAYVVYYWLFRRPAKMAREALGPFLTFYTLLTDGATAGFDRQLMSVFHPALLKDGQVEKGMLRAMARCLCATFGPVVQVPRETVVLKRDGMQVNCVALVNFARARHITCQLSWVRRSASARALAAQDAAATAAASHDGRQPEPLRRFSLDEVVDGIGMAPLGSFHVTSFHIEPVKGGSGPLLDVLKYIKIDEFEYFAETFVERIFAKPPVAAVKMMVPALQEKHLKDGALALQQSVEKVTRACGGLGSRGVATHEVDATLTREEVLQPPKDSGKSADKPNADGLTCIDGIEMAFQVGGALRNLEVYVRITFSGLQCLVTRYEVRVLPDERTQVLLDRDTGTTTVIG